MRADVFAKLNQQFLSAIEAECPMPRWQGLRIVAADASTVRLTLLDKDKVRKIVDAVTFGLFLPGIELCLACTLYPLCCNERQMLFEHLALLRQDDLLVLDRGYPGAWLVAVLSQTRIPFCIRCDMASTFKIVKEFARSSLAEAVVTLPAPCRRDAADYECERVVTQVRLIRVIAANGRSFIVMTSLMDDQAYPAAAFGDIYHARWRIEEAFKRLKHRLNLEHTSGLSWLSACQDFGAKVVCDNLNALAHGLPMMTAWPPPETVTRLIEPWLSTPSKFNWDAGFSRPCPLPERSLPRSTKSSKTFSNSGLDGNNHDLRGINPTNTTPANPLYDQCLSCQDG